MYEKEEISKRKPHMKRIKIFSSLEDLLGKYFKKSLTASILYTRNVHFFLKINDVATRNNNEGNVLRKLAAIKSKIMSSIMV